MRVWARVLHFQCFYFWKWATHTEMIIYRYWYFYFPERVDHVGCTFLFIFLEVCELLATLLSPLTSLLHKNIVTMPLQSFIRLSFWVMSVQTAKLCTDTQTDKLSTVFIWIICTSNIYKGIIFEESKSSVEGQGALFGGVLHLELMWNSWNLIIYSWSSHIWADTSTDLNEQARCFN